jgi:hypothetical protein
MKHDLALPMPGTAEPQAKPSKTVKFGEKPVLPPPPKPLDEAAVAQVVKAKADAPPAAVKPVITEAPPPVMRVEREPLPAAPQPMKRERTKSGVHKLKKVKKPAPRQNLSMDDECAVMAMDPRRSRNE